MAHHKRVAEEVSRRFGGFDIYFANTGVIDLKPSEAISEASYDRHFDVNTKGVFFGAQTLLPLMRHGGTIIVTSSLAATKVLPDHTVYAGSKAAVVAFVKNWALELKTGEYERTLGPTDTEILGKLGIPDAERGPFLNKIAETIPQEEWEPARNWRKPLSTASDASAFINGIDLHVDGGMGLI